MSACLATIRYIDLLILFINLTLIAVYILLYLVATISHYLVGTVHIGTARNDVRISTCHLANAQLSIG